jgi:hypothetical protein
VAALARVLTHEKHKFLLNLLVNDTGLAHRALPLMQAMLTQVKLHLPVRSASYHFWLLLPAFPADVLALVHANTFSRTHRSHRKHRMPHTGDTQGDDEASFASRPEPLWLDLSENHLGREAAVELAAWLDAPATKLRWRFYCALNTNAFEDEDILLIANAFCSCVHVRQTPHRKYKK